MRCRCRTTASPSCIELDSDAEKGAKDHISVVRESSLGAPLRDCITPADALVLHTGSKWNFAKLELCVFAAFMVLSHEVRCPVRALIFDKIFVCKFEPERSQSI